MKKIALAAALASLLGGAHAAVITFDDIAVNDYEALSNGYAGLNWRNVDVINGSHFSEGYLDGLVSGRNAAFNPYGYDATISAATSSGFYLTSGYFTAGVQESLQVTANAIFLDGRTASLTFTVGDRSPTFETFGWTNLESVTFTAGNAAFDQFVIDNLTAGVVPEPASVALMLGGLGLVGFARRRKA